MLHSFVRISVLRSLFLCGMLLVSLAGHGWAQAGRFAVQFGAVPDRAEADSKLEALKTQGVSAYIVKSQVPGKGLFFRIRTGNFASRPAAEKYGQQLKSQGIVSEFYVATYETPETAPTPAVATAQPAPAASVPVIKPTTATPPPTAKPNVANVPPPTAAPSSAPVGIKSAVITPPVSTAAATTPNVSKPQPKTTALPPATVATKPAPVNAAPTNATPATTAAATNSPAASSSNSAAALNSSTAKPALSGSLAGFAKYLDQGIGYSFEHPAYWVGGALNNAEAQTPTGTSSAMFKSNEDAAFLNAIWNKLDKANSNEHDNDMIVDLILKSMSSGNGTQNMVATNRTVINEGANIKTYFDMKAAFQVPNQPAPLDFLGKGVIIRAAKGILLVVTFYAKDAPQTVGITADHIVKTARTPE